MAPSARSAPPAARPPGAPPARAPPPPSGRCCPPTRLCHGRTPVTGLGTRLQQPLRSCAQGIGLMAQGLETHHSSHSSRWCGHRGRCARCLSDSIKTSFHQEVWGHTRAAAAAGAVARPLGAAAALVAPLGAQQVGVCRVPLAQQAVHLLAGMPGHHVRSGDFDSMVLSCQALSARPRVAEM